MKGVFNKSIKRNIFMTTGIGIIRLNANYLKEEYYGIKLFFNPCRIIYRVM